MTTIDYSKRDFEGIKGNLIGFIQDNFPDTFNDFYEDNSGIMLVELMSYVGDLLAYYLDMNANEPFIRTAKMRTSIAKLGELVGYRLNGPTPAKLTVSGSIPATQVGETGLNPEAVFYINKNGKSYPWYLLEGLSISEGELTAEALAVQGAYQTEIFTSTGEPRQKIVVGNKNASFSHIQVLINDDPWEESNFFLFADSNSKFYRVWSNEEGFLVLSFGDGKLGAIPPVGAEIKIKYLIPDGFEANVVPGDISEEIESDTHPGVMISLSNVERSSGASEQESIEKARKTIPGFTRSVNRLFSKKDYKDLLGGYPSVKSAAIYDINDLCVENIYVRPFQILCYLTFEDQLPANETTLLEIQSWVNARKNAGTDVEVRNAEPITISIMGSISLLSGSHKPTVFKLCHDALQNLFKTNDIGKNVPESQIITVLQQVPGVAEVVLNSFIPNIGRHQIARLGQVTLS